MNSKTPPLRSLNFRCVCEHGDILEVDDDPAQCDAEPTPVLCAANKACKFHIVFTFVDCVTHVREDLTNFKI